MGRPFLEHLGGKRFYNCEHCGTYLSNRKEIISHTFRGATGQAYLFRSVVNIKVSKVETRYMITGQHMVRDVFCKNCRSKLGWMYEFACDHDQSYKEGHVILERKLLRESDETDPGLAERNRPLTRTSSASSVSSSGINSFSTKMTILPKGKKSHSLAKAERYNAVRGGDIRHLTAQAIQLVILLVMRTGLSHTTVILLPTPILVLPFDLSLILPSRTNNSIFRGGCYIRCYDFSTFSSKSGTALITSNQSQAQVSTIVGPGSSLLISSSGAINSPQSPSANPVGLPSLQAGGKGTEKSLPVVASSSKRKPGSTSKNRQAHHQQNAENYNSDDEYGSGFKDDELEIRFAERLKKARGLVIKEVKGMVLACFVL
uniref:Yippee domain-containing protein n=1 Tax=Ditylenchus dipsaci TaxID=166011 RepID=A0A915EBU3_9BILA